MEHQVPVLDPFAQMGLMEDGGGMLGALAFLGDVDARNLAVALQWRGPGEVHAALEELRAAGLVTRRGTAFHLWVERQFTDAATLFGDEYLDYLDPLDDDSKLEDLKAAWLKSTFANRTPARVEVPFETTIGGVLIRGRIDAIYSDGDGFQVVDWKTGSKQLGKSTQVQLAMYRLAWAKLSGCDISTISAAFHYVPTGVTDSPSDLLDEAALIALITSVEDKQ